MREKAGQHLNGEIMRSFLMFVQHFPIGAHVQVIGGQYDGALGVVVSVSGSAPTRPCVRLLFDSAGRRRGDGFELDMRQPTTVDRYALPETGNALDSAATHSRVTA